MTWGHLGRAERPHHIITDRGDQMPALVKNNYEIQEQALEAHLFQLLLGHLLI